MEVWIFGCDYINDFISRNASVCISQERLDVSESPNDLDAK
jgi:hypothetical protein